MKEHDVCNSAHLVSKDINGTFFLMMERNINSVVFFSVENCNSIRYEGGI